MRLFEWSPNIAIPSGNPGVRPIALGVSRRDLVVHRATELQWQGQQPRAVPRGCSPSHPCELEARKTPPPALGRLPCVPLAGDLLQEQRFPRSWVQHQAELSGPTGLCPALCCLLLPFVYMCQFAAHCT